MRPEPKPVREWLEELPEPYRAAAKRSCDPAAGDHRCIDLSGAVVAAFEWKRTPEGFDFWSRARKAIALGSPLPPYPGPAGENPYDRAAKEAAERWAKRDQQQQARIHQLERLAEKRGKELERVRGELDAAAEARDHWHRRYFEDRNWRPIETAPRNQSVLIYLPNHEHYGEPIYRAIFVDMGSGERWNVTGLNMGRDVYNGDAPTHWMPLPEPPASTEGGGE